MPIRWHEEDPVLFEAAIRLTAGETGFPPRLIEKDYFCSVLLEHLAARCGTLIFRGGTCLAKVHAGFHRLSEDLDFSISVTRAVGRANRSRCVDPLRDVVREIAGVLPAFRVVEPLTGSNQSTQYNAVLGYASRVGDPEIIKVEVGLREPTVTATHEGPARTALLNPLSRQEMVAPFAVPCLSYAEAMAEKLRAALCRRDAAIRDFFDVDHAVQQAGFDAVAADIIDLVRVKLAVQGTGAVDVSQERLAQLRRQLDSELRPVVHPVAFEQFDLDRAFDSVRGVAERLG